ncbi:hypothetical protein [Brucella gallinifaecis]|uniref:hypothetical protein n=1 Tax=Brucella gallinifaecis TaxID=215590 RepID=UPI002362A5DE|nr:hypothetical protein [Brucella gallinifaecis]
MRAHLSNREQTNQFAKIALLRIMGNQHGVTNLENGYQSHQTVELLDRPDVLETATPKGGTA